MKILAFAATNNTQSINQQLVKCTVDKFNSATETKIIDLNDFKLPLFSLEIEAEGGVPQNAQKFVELVDWADLIIIGFAEYNGTYTPVFKNLLDWASRIRQRLWNDTDLLFLSTSPGGRGGQNVLNAAEFYAPHMAGKVVGIFSLPSFNKNFKDGHITDPKLNAALNKIVEEIQNPKSTSDSGFVQFLQKLSTAWVLIGWAVFSTIVITGLIGQSLLSTPYAEIFWHTALYAATFTLIIKPIYDLSGQKSTFEAMLGWRKGIGLISSSIVVGFWLNRYLDPTDLGKLLSYFQSSNWSIELINLLSRTSELTAWTLFLISNKWMVKNFNGLWRGLQKCSYVYFLSAASFLYLAYDKTYALICLLVFFGVYQAWIYWRIGTPENLSPDSRKSQAS